MTVRELPDGRAPGLLDRKLVFVTGKGGTGKTTIAAALALLASEQGRRVLVCETEARGGLSRAFDCGPTRFEPREIAPQLFAMSMDTEASLREYLRVQLHVPSRGVLSSFARALDVVATAAPGIREVLTVGKLCYEVREHHYDVVIVDAAASGQIVGELAAPVGISELIHVGAIRNQTDWMIEILADERRTGAAIVATPEEMPVTEAADLAKGLAERTPVHLGAMIVNRVLPELFGRGEEAVFDALGSGPVLEALGKATETSPARVRAMLDAASFAVGARRAASEHIEVARRFAEGAPLVLLPFLFARPSGPRAVRMLAHALDEEFA